MSAVTIAKVNAALPGWDRRMAEAGLAEGTRENNVKHAGLFLDWLTDWDDVARDRAFRETGMLRFAVGRYEDWLKDMRYAPGYVAQAVLAVDKMSLWLGLGSLQVSVSHLRPARRSPVALTKVEQRAFLRAAGDVPRRSRWSDLRRVREVMIARLLLGCGPRVEEFTGLDVADAPHSGSKGNLRLLGKGGRLRNVPVPRAGVEGLHEWMRVHPMRHTPPEGTPLVVATARGATGRMTDRTVREIVAGIGKRAGIVKEVDGQRRGVHPHMLRHSFGTNLVRDGHDLVVVAELLGHADLNTVRLYTLPTAEDVAQAVEDVWPDRM